MQENTRGAQCGAKDSAAQGVGCRGWPGECYTKAYTCEAACFVLAARNSSGVTLRAKLRLVCAVVPKRRVSAQY